MGYTHYWHQSADFTDDQWSAICKDTRKILTYCRKKGIAIQYEYNDTRVRSCVTKSEIHFNGSGPDGHETFYVPFCPSEDLKEFNFCKTDLKSYDLAVCLCLLRMIHHCSAFSISSDGEWEDWYDARETYAKIFKEQPPKFQ